MEETKSVAWMKRLYLILLLWTEHNKFLWINEMFELITTGQYKKDCRRMEKRGKDMEKLDAVIEMLCKEEFLPESYLEDHPLHGESKGCRECHIEPDWLLKYKTDNKELVLVVLRTGSHSDLRLC